MPVQSSEELPSLKLLKKLSQEEHKLSSLQEAAPGTPGSGGAALPKTSSSSRSLDQPSFTLGSLFDRLSPSRKTPLLPQQQQQPQEHHSGPADVASLFDVNMLIGAAEFQRHGKSEGGMSGGGQSGQSLSLEKLASLEEYMTRRPRTEPQPAQHVLGGVNSELRSSTPSLLDATTQQSSSSGSQRLHSQKRLPQLGASQSARDLGPRTAAASAAAAAGAAAIAAIDSSCASSEQVLLLPPLLPSTPHAAPLNKWLWTFQGWTTPPPKRVL
ncbi:hypothetical protein DUNSADRAFT_7051 [Dunaliella salina]|uniref:Uncharacterized protein n=1 Tax=Dunaliella salina TaxID=3046 RepID=A0ABQ7H6F9_DUNSA|nr:hypothetical protein DUNSADRAFT_7051 [Dunaliella salina]|eukprot:KAF5842442.1 hypothetical protein DUNSADRAFT_7051 [Dunaliella salina]